MHNRCRRLASVHCDACHCGYCRRGHSTHTARDETRPPWGCPGDVLFFDPLILEHVDSCSIRSTGELGPPLGAVNECREFAPGVAHSSKAIERLGSIGKSILHRRPSYRLPQSTSNTIVPSGDSLKRICWCECSGCKASLATVQSYAPSTWTGVSRTMEGLAG